MVYKMSVALAGVLLIVGILLVAVGTGHATPGQYFSPAQILPGVSVLYLGAVFAAWGLAKSGPHAMKGLYAWTLQRASQANAATFRAVFLLLTVIFGISWMSDGSTSTSTSTLYRAIQANLAISAAYNVLFSFLAATGLYGWLFQIFLPNERTST
jgi:hypothetical protein